MLTFSNPSRNLAIETINQSIEYEYLSQQVSPHLLTLHQITSGQVLIPGIPSSSRDLLQLPITIHIEEEHPPDIYILEPQSSNRLQQIPSTDLKTRILQTEIDYLQKQLAEATANGDLTEQLAAERAISAKLKALAHLREKQKPSQIVIQEHSTLDPSDQMDEKQSKTSILSSTISEKSNTKNQIDQQIRGLVKKHVKQLQKHLQENTSKSDQKDIIHSVKDLRQLSIFF